MLDHLFEILNFRIEVGLAEDDIRLILKQYNSFFITDELSPDIYSIKDTSEVVYTRGDHEGNLKFKFDDIGKKTNLFLPVLEGLLER